MVARGYQAAGSVYSQLAARERGSQRDQDRNAARNWYRQALSAWQALEKQPGFLAMYRKEMETAADALAALDGGKIMMANAYPGLNLTLHEKRLVRMSFDALQEYSGAVVLLFYGRLFELAPAVRGLFKISIEEQSHKLLGMLGTVVEALDHFDTLRPQLFELGRRHLGYGVQPAHYDTLRIALLWALGRALEAEFDRETRQAWDHVLRGVSAVMLEGAALTVPPHA